MVAATLLMTNWGALLQTAAFDKGKGEDTFGADDADWLLYRKMAPPSQGGDSDEAEEDEAELATLTARLHEIDPTFQPGERGTCTAPRTLSIGRKCGWGWTAQRRTGCSAKVQLCYA